MRGRSSEAEVPRAEVVSKLQGAGLQAGRGVVGVGDVPVPPACCSPSWGPLWTCCHRGEREVPSLFSRGAEPICVASPGSRPAECLLLSSWAASRATVIVLGCGLCIPTSVQPGPWSGGSSAPPSCAAWMEALSGGRPLSTSPPP